MTDRLELAERFLNAFNSRDPEAACAVTAPDVEFTVIAEQVTGALPDGHAGLLRWFADSRRTWERLEVDPSGIEIEDRGDWLLASGITRAVASGTERNLVWLWTAVVKVEGEKISRFGIYLSRDEALRAMEDD